MEFETERIYFNEIPFGHKKYWHEHDQLKQFRIDIVHEMSSVWADFFIPKAVQEWLFDDACKMYYLKTHISCSVIEKTVPLVLAYIKKRNLTTPKKRSGNPNYANSN